MSGLGDIPGAAILRETIVWRRLRHRLSLLVGPRTNSHFTGFLRLPEQFSALVGPVMARFAGRSRPLSVCVLGCSNGAEAYTIASLLRRHHPNADFRIYGYDIDGACIEKARTACYSADEIYNNKIIPNDFVEWTFERYGDSYRVKPFIAEQAEFALGDVLSVDLPKTVGAHDIIFAQNFLFHLRRRDARTALENISRLMRPGSALFIDGVDLDLRRTFAHEKKLVPLDFQIEQIHNEARRARSVGWPYSYWGLEPFLTTKRDWQTRYATIFCQPIRRNETTSNT